MDHSSHENLLEEARLLMPWYLTNRLSSEQKNLVDEALAQYPSLQDEFAHEEKIMQLVNENVSLLDLTTLDTPHQRLDKLLKRINKAEEVSESLEQAHEPAPTFCNAQAQQNTSVDNISTASDEQKQQGGFSNWFKSLFDINWLTPANAVFASLLAVQVTLMGVYLHSENEQHHDHGSYEVASIDQPSKHDNLLLIEFNKQAKHGQVCNFLNRHNAEIVTGPSANNIFTVKINSLAKSQSIDDTMNKMRAEQNAPTVFIGKLYSE